MDLSVAFITGFLSSLHCAGMCGPLVLAYSTQNAGDGPFAWRTLVSHIVYNSGRVLSYGIVGGILGFIGGSIGTLKGIGFWFSGGVGIATIAFGVSVLRGASLLPFGEAQRAGRVGTGFTEKLLGMYRASFGALISRKTPESRFYIGLLTPLLPCGLLYGMLVRSAGAGSIFEGASLMIAFGLGIVPSLFAAGILGSFLSSKTRRWADRIAALMLIIMGASLIWRAVMAGLGGGAHAMHQM